MTIYEGLEPEQGDGRAPSEEQRELALRVRKKVAVAATYSTTGRAAS